MLGVATTAFKPLESIDYQLIINLKIIKTITRKGIVASLLVLILGVNYSATKTSNKRNLVFAEVWYLVE
jgi:hypothetical protein